MSKVKNRRNKEDAGELDVTTFLNLMVVLIPFLLATAVFSQITVQELNLPASSAGGANPEKPPVVIEVMIRKDKLEIGDGKSINTTIPMKDGKYDVVKLSEELLDLKKQNTEKEDINVLLEPDIDYQSMIKVMDAVKSIKIKNPGQTEEQTIVLYPEVSIGDAP